MSHCPTAAFVLEVLVNVARLWCLIVCNIYGVCSRFACERMLAGICDPFHIFMTRDCTAAEP